MIEIEDFFVALALAGLGFALVRFTRLNWGVAGAWLNLLWFIYQTSFGSGWVGYHHGLGVAFVLAAGWGQYGLAWALVPWPLLIYLRLELGTYWPYLPNMAEGMLLGGAAYLLTGWAKRSP